MKTLSDILGQLDEPTGNTKVANQQNRRTPTDTDAAITAALQSIGSSKVASEGTDVSASLLKMAQDLSAADHDAEKKAAYEYGREMGRGLVDELAAYTKAASDLQQETKVASQGQNEQMLVEKFAQEDPRGFEAVVEQGYADQMAFLNKQASENAETEQAFVEKFASEDPSGFEAAVQHGYDEATRCLHKIAQDQFNAGYQHTITTHVKVAADHFAFGFNAMNELIKTTRQAQGQARRA